MRRISKGKRRKSENSSDAESGENGGNVSKIDDSDQEKLANDDEEPKAKRRSYSRGRDKSLNLDDSKSMDDEETANDSKHENGSSDKRKRKPTTSHEVDENEEEVKEEDDKPKSEKESEDEDDFEVEKIVKQRIMKGQRQYLVRWKGYDASDDTWKNEDELNCPQLVEEFLAHEDDKSDVEVDENAETPKPKSKKRTKASPKSKKKGQKAAKAKKRTNNTDSEVNENGKSPKKSRKSKSAKNDKKHEEEGEGVKNEEEEEEEEFEVEKILEVQFKKNKSREFLIRWKGFTAKDDTWEPEDNLNCPDLINKFMEKVEKAKNTDTKELRTNPSHTKRYTLAMHSSGRRLSRRNIDKQRMTYHECDD